MLERSPSNPLIKPSDVKPSAEGFQVVGAFNPGAAVFGDEIVLLLRVAETCVPEPGKVRVPVYEISDGRGVPKVLEFDENDPDVVLRDTRGVAYKGKEYLSSISHIRVARSRDGVEFEVDDEPFIFPCRPDEEYGIEDARVNVVEGRYIINYTIVSRDGWCTAISETEDFKTHRRLSVAFHPQNKDVSIFPEKIGGGYAALHRPNNDGFGKPSIWYAESPDLIHWGNHRCVARPRNRFEESAKIGGGSAPMKTDRGWLCVYHAKDADSKYRLYSMLLDLERPWEVVARGETPILEPELPYETNGFFGNVVFTNGMVEKDGKLFMYYGASDETACLAVGHLEDFMPEGGAR